MKLIAVMGALHFDKEMKQIFDKNEIKIYSRMNMNGHKEEETKDLAHNWFATSNEYQESVIFFSFTTKERAEKVLESVKIFNKGLTSKSRVKAFIMAVENHN